MVAFKVLARPPPWPGPLHHLEHPLPRHARRLAPSLLKRFEQHGQDLPGRCGLRFRDKAFAVARTKAPGRWPLQKSVVKSRMEVRLAIWRARPGPPPRAACTIPAPRAASGRSSPHRDGRPMPGRTASSGAIPVAAGAPWDCSQAAARGAPSGRPAASQEPAFASGPVPCRPVDLRPAPARSPPGPLRPRGCIALAKFQAVGRFGVRDQTF